MKLLHLFEEITKLEEAASDRYLLMFTGIFNLLDQYDQLATSTAKSDAAAQYLTTDPERAEFVDPEGMEVAASQQGAEVKQNIQEQVNWAMSVLGRADRITWWLRW